MKQHLAHYLLGHSAGFYHIPLITRLDNNIIYDAKLVLSMLQERDDSVAIADIDKYHVAVLGFDVVFAGRDDSSGLKHLEMLAGNQMKDIPAFMSALQNCVRSATMTHTLPRR